MVPDVCPRCGSAVTKPRAGWLQCITCKWGAPVDAGPTLTLVAPEEQRAPATLVLCHGCRSWWDGDADECTCSCEVMPDPSSWSWLIVGAPVGVEVVARG